MRAMGEFANEKLQLQRGPFKGPTKKGCLSEFLVALRLSQELCLSYSVQAIRERLTGSSKPLVQISTPLSGMSAETGTVGDARQVVLPIPTTCPWVLLLFTL